MIMYSIKIKTKYQQNKDNNIWQQNMINFINNSNNKWIRLNLNYFKGINREILMTSRSGRLKLLIQLLNIAKIINKRHIKQKEKKIFF